jgi:RHS repeat-associated protein
LQDIRVIDLNADGIDDIVYEYRTTPTSTTSTFYYMLCNGSSFTQPVQMGDPQTFSVNAGLTGKTRRTLDRQEDDNEHTANPRDRPSSSSSLSFSKYKNFVDADYNGDGVNDIFMNDLNGNWKIYSLVNSSEQMTSVMNLLASGTISTLNGDVLSGDFNGDGKADIWSFEDNGVNIYTFTGTTLSLLYHSSWPTNKHFFTLGDFNGDGKVDVFLYGYGKGGTEYDWADWQIQLSTGTGFEGHSMTQKKSNLKNDNVRLGDFNGDGATDIMVTSKDFSWTGSYFYISENNGTDFFTDSLPSYPIPSHNFYLADYNGDGHTDFICTDGVSPFWTGYQVYKTTGNTSIMMGKFSNGLGVLTKFDYIKLSQATSWTYQRGTGASYPVIDFQGALTVVDSVQVDNGVGSKNIQMYYYEGAKIHIQGKGFLGYSKTRTTDVTAGIENENISGYSTTYFYPKLLQTLSRRRFVTETVDETDNTYSEVVIDASKKRIFPYIQSSVQSNYLTGLSSTINFQYDTYGNPTLITKNYSNGLTETTSTTYNNTVSSSRWLLGRPDTSTIQYSLNGSPTITRSGTRVFDQNNNHLTSETWYSGTNQIINSFGYNPNGTLKRETGTANGVSRSKSYTYESDSIRTYSSTDQLSHVITKAYDIYGRIDTLQDYFGNTVTYQYDDMGRESNMSKSDGTQTSTAYAWEDPTAAPVPARYSVQKTGNDGSQSKSWYDDLGRVIQSGVKGFDGTWIYTSTIYNTKGQIESTSDPYYSGSTALLNTFSYDDYGRKTNLSRPSGRNTVWGYENNTFSEITAGKSSSKTFSSDGTISSATDEGGTITYTYYPDGKVKTITTPGGIITSMQYDPAGYQSQLVDPSAGTTTYSYNGFGELVSQVSGRNKTTSLVYNPEGTISQKITPEGTSRYIYNTNKQLISVHSPGNIYRFYRYDNKGRIITSIDTIGSSHYTTSVTYDNKGRIDTLIHPSGIIETNTYNLNGYLSSISANGVVHWTTTGVNARQQVTSGRYGNNLNAIYGYDTYGFPTSTVTDTIQNYSYNFDPVTGNLNWRQNNKHSNLKETFYYDNLDRIDSVYKGTTSPVKTLQMTYDINIGGITTKSDVGTLNYPTSGIKPYAVSNINPSSGIIPNSVDSLTYTSFESVNAIYENNNIAHFTYNSDNERVKMDVQQSGSSILTRWYPTSSYIIETSGGVTKEYTFIGGDAYSAPVVAIKQNDTITYYNLLRDYLGSIMQVVNATTNTQVVEYSYDTWGRMRDPITWENYPPGSEPVLIIAGRGFTGHEHLPWFNLINMNGRVYDPLTGSFLSPDPEVQAPDNTQSFNRYTYCLNNPLKYSDPSGYTWFSNFGDWLGSSGKTIVTITAACAVAVAVACIPGLNAVGIAFVGGMLSGATSGGLGAALNGGDVFSGAVMGGIMGAATGLATLGVTSAIGYGLDNIYIGYDRVGINDFFNIGIRQTMSNQSLASILSVGSVINGVSNTALSSGITGGVLSTSLFPRPTIATIPETSRDWIVYSANMTNTYRSSGSLLWYHNGNIMARYSAVSGSGRTLNRNTPAYTIPEGEYSASNYRILNSPYYQNGVGFGVDLTPGNVYDPLQDCYRDGGFLIHPASGGTLGCVGLTGNQCELLDFQSRINTYILINHTIKLYVNYH